MTIPTSDLAILGAGPVGLIAALQSAKLQRTLLITRAQPTASRVATPRIESVPAALVNLLLDFSLDPRRFGVDRLHDTRHTAWETSDPATTHGRATAHLDHNLLAAELLAVACRQPLLEIKSESESQIPVMRNGLWHGSSWRARTLLDATGRAMVMSQRRSHPQKPWVARPFWRIASSTQAGHLSADRSFRIAALSFGYIYRMASNTTDMVWVVGRGEGLSESPAALERTLKSSDAGWLLEGFAPLTTANTGRSHPASVQWSEASPCSTIGDAALSRDILSSHGLAAGISDALYAAAVHNDDDAALWAHRHAAERAAHLKSLQQVFAASRHRNRPAWRAYAEFVAKHQSPNAFSDGAALIGGRLARPIARSIA